MISVCFILQFILWRFCHSNQNSAIFTTIVQISSETTKSYCQLNYTDHHFRKYV